MYLELLGIRAEVYRRSAMQKGRGLTVLSFWEGLRITYYHPDKGPLTYIVGIGERHADGTVQKLGTIEAPQFE